MQEIIGGLAQLARALAWHARGHRFEPDILHHTKEREVCHKKGKPLVVLCGSARNGAQAVGQRPTPIWSIRYTYLVN